jgi:hypothetical protein
MDTKGFRDLYDGTLFPLASVGGLICYASPRRDEELGVRWPDARVPRFLCD